jgi:hypothetical protein
MQARGPRRFAVTQGRELEVGQLRRQVRLQSEAIYRVCGWTETLVQVTVVRAPGLRSGQRFTFTRSAVAGMEVLAEEDGSAQHA